MSVDLMMPFKYLILCCPLLLLPSIFPSIRDFSSESALHIRWSKYWSFSFSISPSNEYSGLISLRTDWFDFFIVQGTLKSLLQHHSSVQSLSCVWHFATPWTAACQASLFITNSWSLLKFMSIESVMPSNHLNLCCPLLLPPSIFPSIRAFSNESVHHNRWPKYYSFSFSFSPSNEYSGLTSFRMDWLGLLAVQGTLKSLLQHHSSKALILLLCFLYSPTHIHTWLLGKP